MKVRLLSSLLLLLPFLSHAQAPVTNQNLYDTVPTMQEHYGKRVALFAKEPIVTSRVMFVGNSITEGGQWGKLLGDTTVINRGVSGDVTFGVLQRLEDITSRKPAKLFLLIGINDIGKDIPDAVIAHNYGRIIRQIQAKSPGTKIYVQSLFPVNSDHPKFPQHYDKQAHVLHVNQLLKKLAADTQCRFVDLFPLFLDAQKRLDRKYTYDGLHLSQAGYELWVKHLKQTGCL